MKNKIYILPLLLLPLVAFMIVPALIPSAEEPAGTSDENEETGGEYEGPEEELPDIDRLSLNDIVEPYGSLGPISSLLISQKGNILIENYYGGMRAESAHNIKSASKSILSLMVGIAIDKGYLEGTHQTIEEFFPEYFSRNPDSPKANITIGDLLTMRSGLRSTSGGNYGAWVTSRDWIDYALSRPLVEEPGTERIYSTGNTHLLGVALARATDMSLLEFGNRYLFGPMNIRVGGWDRDPQGYYLGGNNMALRPRDMVKIGEMMMAVGEYNGQQIVSSDWIKESVLPVTGRFNNNDYGYLWFRRTSGKYEVVYALGNGGQYIVMIPELESVVTITTRIGASGTRRYRRELINHIDDNVVPWLAASTLGNLD